MLLRGAKSVCYLKHYKRNRYFPKLYVLLMRMMAKKKTKNDLIGKQVVCKYYIMQGKNNGSYGWGIFEEKKGRKIMVISF